MKAFALTGRILYIFLIPRVLPWAKKLAGLSARYINHIKELTVHLNCQELTG